MQHGFNNWYETGDSAPHLQWRTGTEHHEAIPGIRDPGPLDFELLNDLELQTNKEYVAKKSGHHSLIWMHMDGDVHEWSFLPAMQEIRSQARIDLLYFFQPSIHLPRSYNK